MKSAVDVHYGGDTAVAACVVFEEWTDASPAEVLRVAVGSVAPYRTGRFFERELPCLLAVLREVGRELDTIVVDGFVHLRSGWGLGAHLHHALDERPTVIGVAKRPLKVAVGSVPILRGRSVKPLFVSAIGCGVDEAAEAVQGMHGSYRLPTLLRLADRSAREG